MLRYQTINSVLHVPKATEGEEIWELCTVVYVLKNVSTRQVVWSVVRPHYEDLDNGNTTVVKHCTETERLKDTTLNSASW